MEFCALKLYKITVMFCNIHFTSISEVKLFGSYSKSYIFIQRNLICDITRFINSCNYHNDFKCACLYNLILKFYSIIFS